MDQPDPSPTDPVEQFAKSWRAGHSDPSQFVEQYPNLNPQSLSAILRIDLRNRWDSPDRKLAKYYIETFPRVAADDEAVIDLIYTEYLLLKRQHGEINDAQFADQFPRYRSTLIAQFALHRLTETTQPGAIRSNATTDVRAPHLEGLSTLPATGEHVPVHSSKATSLPCFAGRYQAVALLGRGGMGTVWEARELASGRHVAVKQLQARWSQCQRSLDLFLREGRLAASISHPRSAYLLEAIVDGDEPLLVMELMPGKTLADVSGLSEDLTLPRVVQHALDLIDGLEAIHKTGVIHRDLKPSNCFLDAQGRAKVGDYGLAVLLQNSVNPGTEFVGTPAFSSPEQVLCQELTPLSDQYSLGATIFYLIAKRPPFSGDMKSIFNQVLHEKPELLNRVSDAVPDGLAQIVDRCLAKDPSHRFQSLSALRGALLPYSRQPRTLEIVGRRFTAYAIDQLIIFLLSGLLAAALAVGWIVINSMSKAPSDTLVKSIASWTFVSAVISYALEFAYFAFSEGIYGCTLGKRALRLRVVSRDSSPASLKSCLIRSAMLPGGFGLGLLHVFVTTNQVFDGWISSLGASDTLLLIFIGIAFQSPLLLCVSTIRTTNDFRGLHEILSGTRTILLQKRQADENLAIMKSDTVEPQVGPVFGPYQAVSMLLSNDSFISWDAVDIQLDRHVWICQRLRPVEDTSQNHSTMDRPTRLRYLRTAQSDTESWIAFEAVPGRRLRKEILLDKDLCWDQFKVFVLDLATELLLSIREDSLPEPISFDHLWMYSNYRLKLMDEPMLGMVTSEVQSETEFSGSRRAVMLLHTVLRISTEGKRWPRQPVELYQRVDAAVQKPQMADHDLIAGIVSDLKKTVDLQMSLSRQDRLGLLGMYLLIPGWLTLWMCLLSADVFSDVFSNNVMLAFLTHAGLSLALPILISSALVTPLLLSLMKVEVLDVRSQRAHTARFFLRDAIGWLPLCIFGLCFGWFAVIGRALSSDSNLKDLNPDAFLLTPHFVLVCAAVCLVCIMIGVAGAVCFVLKPEYSVPDKIAGTRLHFKSDP